MLIIALVDKEDEEDEEDEEVPDRTMAAVRTKPIDVSCDESTPGLMGGVRVDFSNKIAEAALDDDTFLVFFNDL